MITAKEAIDNILSGKWQAARPKSRLWPQKSIMTFEEVELKNGEIVREITTTNNACLSSVVLAPIWYCEWVEVIQELNNENI